ncbi:desmoglein-2.1-like [Nelusetta ayraudi]|uniref:desmoglein-2.1-like n=1 Tax=Nelusetta ayraudi TaxID=303726 RepID=UPI003F6E546D
MQKRNHPTCRIAAALLNAMSVPRKPLKENFDCTGETVGRIFSYFDDGTGNIVYSLTGNGSDQYPFNVFQVDPDTGLIRVNKILDREEIAFYRLSGAAHYRDGTLAQDNLPMPFRIVDENDNTPVFAEIKPGVVTELSAKGTSVLKITATDADEPGNPNSQIAYSIVNQDPADIFFIKSNGTICVRTPPDREAADKHTLTVKAQDLYGAAGGNAATSTVTISVTDVNDNLPTLEKEQYEGSIVENTQGMEVMRFKASDLDLKNTANWEAVYHISKGNEAGYFSIETDPVTNEGILMLDKAVNYKDVTVLDLGIVVRNKAKVHGGGRGGGGGGGGVGRCGVGEEGGGGGNLAGIYKTYPVKVNVQNQPEGAVFDPKVKAIPISEGGTAFNINNVIAHYPAIDGDTGKPAENVRYFKGYDPGNWLIIDPKTGHVRLRKMPDRESKFLVSGTYRAKVLAISEDTPSQTATGTIAIQVEDFNDHCPTLTTELQTVCIPFDSVTVAAEDEVSYPNGPPFDFSIIPEGTEGKWKVERLNDTAAILRAQGTLWPRQYEVEVLVKDEQGKACPEPQRVKVRVCTCEDGVTCGKRGENGQPANNSGLGPAGIGLLCLGLLLSLLAPLLLLFFCLCGSAAGLPGGSTETPLDTKSHLIDYRAEGQGGEQGGASNWHNGYNDGTTASVDRSQLFPDFRLKKCLRELL